MTRENRTHPPRLADILLVWYCRHAAIEDLQGDLEELFYDKLMNHTPREARAWYWRQVITLLFSYAIRRRKAHAAHHVYSITSIHPAMLKNYFKIAWRNLAKHKGYSFISISGLALGMAVSLLIGLWVWDELSFDRYHTNYDRIGQGWQFVQFGGEKTVYPVTPVPLAEELRSKYPDFKRAVMSSFARETILNIDDKKTARTGVFADAGFAEMFSVRIVNGTMPRPQDANAILLSQDLAITLFGADDPINKIIRINNRETATVIGVYEDFPENSSIRDAHFIASWALLEAMDEYTRNARTQWDSNSFQLFVELHPGVSFAAATAAIKDIRMQKPNPPGYKPEFFIHPMRDWHLRTGWRNGVPSGGNIQFVWLFGAIGGFILLLACINFMNLSTARSERRAREVGIRSAIGSARRQLVMQFFSESLLMVALSFGVALVVAQIALPFFNLVAGKHVAMPWGQPVFWLAALAFVFITGLVAGSYPALYLSSFKPVNVLKGTFRAGRFAAVPRKALVVLQFTVSITLIIGTIVVFRQIDHARSRATGYNRDGLIEIPMNTPDLFGHYDALRADLLQTGAVDDMAESSVPITSTAGGTVAIQWRGKVVGENPLIMANNITHDFGHTVGWTVHEGRDFSREYATDSMAMIINQAAATTMKLDDPVGEVIGYDNKQYHIIGVVNDIVRESPFKPVEPAFFILDYTYVKFVAIRLSPRMSLHTAIGKVEDVFRKHNPTSPFDFKFVNVEYAHKFMDEERVGTLATVFAVLAIVISCLGIFGLASFVAEQRTKEIGVRKVLGASVARLWTMLSQEFLILVVLSLVVAIPVAWYGMDRWLEQYTYRTTVSWWIFAAAGAGALLVTLLTVSYQAVKAARANPVKSLRME